MSKSPRKAKPPAGAENEIGYSEQYGWGGVYGAVASWGYRDALGNPNLIPYICDRTGGITHGGYYELAMMLYTDETVGAIMWVITSTLTQVEWRHIPCKNGKSAPKDAKAKKAAAFADELLTDMGHSWTDHLEEALTMVPFGFAPCEINLKIRDGVDSKFNDGRWGIDSLPLREQRSITKWNWENRRLTSLFQSTSAGSAEIPMWKVLHYRINATMNRPQGRSMLLNAYRAWKLKRRIQDSEAIGIDRDLAGLPIFRMPQEDIDMADQKDGQGAPTEEARAARARIDAAKKAVSTMRFHEQDGVVLPSDTYAGDDPETKDRTRKYDLEIMTSAGPRTIDTRNAVRDYDMAIARVLLMQFLQLGTKGGGSYGLSSDQSETAYASLTAIALKIAEEFTRKALPLIWQMNGMDPAYLPRMVPNDLNKEGLQQIGAFLNGVGRSIELWQDDGKARMSILRAAGLEGDQDQQDARAQVDKTPKPKPGAAGLTQPAAAGAGAN